MGGHLSSLLILTVICISCAGAFSAASPTDPTVILQGRFLTGQDQQNATLPQLSSWPASSIYAEFQGSSKVYVNITALPPNGLVYGVNWFRFFVDGEFAADGFTSYNQLDLFVTLNVTSSHHTLRIAKVNDGAKGDAILQSLTLDPRGSFVQPTPPPAIASGRRILFLGDSYSVGTANTGAVLPNTCEPKEQALQQDWIDTCTAMQIQGLTECASLWQGFSGNSLESFTSIAAEALQADFQLIATAGSGLVGYAEAAVTHPNLAPAQYEAILPSNEALFNRTAFASNLTMHDLQSWIPQVVVIASGINDWHIYPPMYTLEQWLDKAIEFLEEVSETYDEPILIIQAFNTTGTNYSSDFVTQYATAMSSLAEEAVKQGIQHVHYLGLQSSNYSDFKSWCDGHPSAVADRLIAQQLVDFILGIVPAWAGPAVNESLDASSAGGGIRTNGDTVGGNMGAWFSAANSDSPISLRNGTNLPTLTLSGNYAPASNATAETASTRINTTVDQIAIRPSTRLYSSSPPPSSG